MGNKIKIMRQVLLVVVLLAYQTSSQKTCNILDYGAKEGPQYINTVPIQNAIQSCLQGGTVVVPAGVFLTYPLTVQTASNFTLMVQGTLQAATMDNWPLAGSQYEDFITMSACKGCAITGGGLLDGQGTPWYIAFDNGELNYRRPNLVVIKKCVDFKLMKIHILNSPMFNVVLTGVKGAEIAYINITDEWYNDGTSEPHNTDGIDPGSDSAGIHIHDVYIYNGDDSVAVKPGTIAGGCTRDILVENCVFHRGHGASIGSIGAGCIQNVTFRNITFYDQMGAVVVKSYNEDVGFVKNITWKDLVIYNTDHCVNINTNYKTTGNPPQLLISDLNLENIVGDKCAYPAHFVCQMEKPCLDISLINVDLLKNAKEKTMVCEYAHGTAKTVQPASCLLP